MAGPVLLQQPVFGGTQFVAPQYPFASENPSAAAATTQDFDSADFTLRDGDAQLAISPQPFLPNARQFTDLSDLTASQALVVLPNELRVHDLSLAALAAEPLAQAGLDALITGGVDLPQPQDDRQIQIINSTLSIQLFSFDAESSSPKSPNLGTALLSGSHPYAAGILGPAIDQSIAERNKFAEPSSKIPAPRSADTWFEAGLPFVARKAILMQPDSEGVAKSLDEIAKLFRIPVTQNYADSTVRQSATHPLIPALPEHEGRFSKSRIAGYYSVLGYEVNSHAFTQALELGERNPKKLVDKLRRVAGLSEEGQRAVADVIRDFEGENKAPNQIWPVAEVLGILDALLDLRPEDLEKIELALGFRLTASEEELAALINGLALVPESGIQTTTGETTKPTKLILDTPSQLQSQNNSPKTVDVDLKLADLTEALYRSGQQSQAKPGVDLRAHMPNQRIGTDHRYSPLKRTATDRAVEGVGATNPDADGNPEGGGDQSGNEK